MCVCWRPSVLMGSLIEVYTISEFSLYDNSIKLLSFSLHFPPILLHCGFRMSISCHFQNRMYETDAQQNVQHWNFNSCGSTWFMRARVFVCALCNGDVFQAIDSWVVCVCVCSWQAATTIKLLTEMRLK